MLFVFPILINMAGAQYVYSFKDMRCKFNCQSRQAKTLLNMLRWGFPLNFKHSYYCEEKCFTKVFRIFLWKKLTRQLKKQKSKVNNEKTKLTTWVKLEPFQEYKIYHTHPTNKSYRYTFNEAISMFQMYQSQVSWGCRINRLHHSRLQRPHLTSVLIMT